MTHRDVTPYNFVGNPYSRFALSGDAESTILHECAMRLRALALLPEISYSGMSATVVTYGLASRGIEC